MHQIKVSGSGLVGQGQIAAVTGDATASAIVLVILTIVLVAGGAYAFRGKEIP
jgi:LPXTG-motif cell wall-anchored protein